MISSAERFRFYFDALEKIIELKEETESEKIDRLYELLSAFFIDVTSEDQFYFKSLNARIIYAGRRFNLLPKTIRFIHVFIYEVKGLRLGKAIKDELQLLYRLGIKILAEALIETYRRPVPPSLATEIPDGFYYKTSDVDVQRYKDHSRVFITGVDEINEYFIGIEEDAPALSIHIKYNVPNKNQGFSRTVSTICRTYGFPVIVNLLNVEVDGEGVFYPLGFVVEPDYLVDVTAVAECCRSSGTEAWLYLLKKFLPFDNTPSILVGNIANFFLDELIADPAQSFRSLFTKVFKQGANALTFALMDDEQVAKIMSDSERHFNNLQKMVKSGFQDNGVQPEDCFLEPSFYSQKYGLQGRLDVYYKNPANSRSAIIELKSAGLYQPNQHQINHNHFVQTLLYELLINSAFPRQSNPLVYVLYSKLEENALRPVPSTKSNQYAALDVRNQLVALEFSLVGMNRKPFRSDNLIQKMIDRLSKTAAGFEIRDLNRFRDVYEKLDATEKKYFCAFASFIAREHLLAKTGVHGSYQKNGVASLWLKELKEKRENFEIIEYLELAENQSASDDPILIFKKTAGSNELANFRTGDIIVLYPALSEKNMPSNVLENQLFKCTIVDLSKNEVKVKLRSRQLNQTLFERVKFWNIEPDALDSSFVHMYKGLFEFGRADQRKRDLLLTREAPAQSSGEIKPEFEESLENYRSVAGLQNELNDEQKELLKKIIQSKDYFLLWGPPGTGKTSFMIKHLIAYLYTQTHENILLLAYTNRAVDEICDAIGQIGRPDQKIYTRIGSRFSTAEKMRPQLLDEKIKTVRTRRELKTLVGGCRIFVATVASISGKPELLQLKRFNRVVIDEASQILEPALAGLLPKFESFILIGDHKQLPAVVTQTPGDSSTKEPELNGLGLKNLRNSLFERLFKRCVESQWTHAFGRLSSQGRMHQDIMFYPGKTFYDDQLTILQNHYPRLQEKPLNYILPVDSVHLEKRLATERFIFLNSGVPSLKGSLKTNEAEALLVALLVKSFYRIFEANGKTITSTSIGVITPYRAQIAQIRKCLEHEKNIPVDDIMIDTVERYQGGARDIILISLCVSDPLQFLSLASYSEEGVDRKLNVALTRAKEHLVIVGNEAILRTEKSYHSLLEYLTNKNEAADSQLLKSF